MIQISFNRIIKDLLPTVLKIKINTTNNLYQWLVSLIAPVKALYVDYLAYRSDSLYEINHTGQVLSLEHILNKNFGTPFPIDHSGSIYIGDGNWLEETYLFNNVDWGSPLNDEPVYLFDNSEMAFVSGSNILLENFPSGATYLDGVFEPTFDIDGKQSYQQVDDNDVKLEWSGSWYLYDSLDTYYTSTENKEVRWVETFTDYASGSILSDWNIKYLTYTYEMTEYDDDDIDFNVYVPMSIYSLPENVNIINAYVSKYKVAGYTYQIIPY